MGRALFPTDDDMLILRAWLAGRRRQGKPDSALDFSSVEAKGATLRTSASSGPALWLDTAGALHAMLGSGASAPVHMRIANAVLEMLGAPERFTVVPGPPGASTTRLEVEFDGRVIDREAPVLIAGPLTISAWRADEVLRVRGRAA